MKISHVKNSLSTRWVVTIGMLILTFATVLFAILFQANRTAITLCTVTLDAIALLFLVLLYVFSSMPNTETNRKNGLFLSLIANTFLAVFFSALSASFSGTPSATTFLFISKSLSYLFTATFFLILRLYQQEFLPSVKSVRIITLLMACFALLYAVALIVNAFSPILFLVSESGFLKETSDYTFFQTGVSLVLLYLSLLFARCDLRTKLALASSVIAPFLVLFLSLFSSVYSWNFPIDAVSDASLVIPLYIIFFNIHLEQQKEILRKDAEQTKLRTAVMLSQIQPHFLYNSLSVIAALCEEDPALAEKAANTFADYLRENMNSVDSVKPIPFTEELKHIKSYVWLEELRFPERLHMQYRIETDDFDVPALSVQPLVENAIKHGVCHKKNGGNVTLAVRDEESAYVITITDDGIGFDPNAKKDDGRRHIGLQSVRSRLQEMVGGTLRVESEIGNGTCVTITIPKEK